MDVFFTDSFDEASVCGVFQKALAQTVIKPADLVAVKVHFGEKGNTGHVKPAQIKPLADILGQHSKNLMLTDANTLYRGMRTNATDHKKIALEHGFGALGLPIVIADGEDGQDEVEVEINARIFKKARIAKKIAEADVMVAVSHFKGHIVFGFGGAIKNIGMGCGSRAGKLEMHSKVSPFVNRENCTGCGACIDHCLFDAIEMIDEKASIIKDKCKGCAGCIAVCAFDAMSVPWQGASSYEVMERTAEYAYGAVKGKRCVYINFVQHITHDCDCLEDSPLIGNDVGVVASLDPVACDRCAYDLTLKAHGGADIFKKSARVDSLKLLDYAQTLGLGSQKYDLIKL